MRGDQGRTVPCKQVIESEGLGRCAMGKLARVPITMDEYQEVRLIVNCGQGCDLGSTCVVKVSFGSSVSYSAHQKVSVCPHNFLRPDGLSARQVHRLPEIDDMSNAVDINDGQTCQFNHRTEGFTSALRPQARIPDLERDWPGLQRVNITKLTLTTQVDPSRNLRRN